MSLFSTIFTAVISVVLTHWLIYLYGPREKQVPDAAEEVQKDQTDDVGWSNPVDQPQDEREVTLNDDGTVKHYLERSQIWSNKVGTWLPFDSSEIAPPPPRCDLHNYFYVNHRYQTVRDKPTKVLTDFSPFLISFLRAHIGDEFFDEEPYYELVKLLPELKTLHEELGKIRSIVDSADATPDEKRDTAREVGASDVDYGHLGDNAINQYLHDMIEHVSVLLDLLDQEYKPIADRLALVTAYGQIEYDLLIYYFERNLTFGAGSETAFVLKSRRYEWGIHPYFQVEGEGYQWNGYGYVSYGITHTIPIFKGSSDLKSLPCVLLTDELRTKLQERGRLYTSYSGIHYRTYYRDRVMVDKRSYDNQGQNGFYGWSDGGVAVPELEEEKLHLLPDSVYGFNLTRKSWSSFLVEDLKPVIFDENAWDHLVLYPDTKALIKGLVEVTRNVNSSRKIISDVISGKGGGLIAVLHGPPGTGKTLTAEAVAEYLQRPLYMVGSSELPTDPPSLESSLRNILQLATSWDAVLLIDEADVYLEQRSLHELERNSLVSVALRVLEYHQGVLFLTTNRIKSFDDAFLSRFSIGIKYPELDKDARRTVWRKFFELAQLALDDKGQDDSGPDGHSKASSESELVDVTAPETESEKSSDRLINITSEDIDELSEKPFNGRTIKNLVRTSQALALASNETLSIEHVKIVVRASEKFLDEFADAKA